jgi:hypothetical protein
VERTPEGEALNLKPYAYKRSERYGLRRVRAIFGSYRPVAIGKA